VDETQIRSLHQAFLDGWNATDASRIGSSFAEDGNIVGFDGSMVNGRAEIEAHLAGIFADHQPASYVAKVREVRSLGSGAVLLRAVVGMVPPGADDIKPDVNAVQSLVAVERDGAWRIALLQTTPAQFDGRPEEAEALTAELRELLAH
jgi:uncharacterized protein (TIGR02246 family)